MQRFYVNKNAQPTGEHEVHNLDANCQHLPDPINRLDLGWLLSESKVTILRKVAHKAPFPINDYSTDCD
jgi:hypothetical protein